jgi:hypothetical protein
MPSAKRRAYPSLAIGSALFCHQPPVDGERSALASHVGETCTFGRTRAKLGQVQIEVTRGLVHDTPLFTDTTFAKDG